MPGQLAAALRDDFGSGRLGCWRWEQHRPSGTITTSMGRMVLLFVDKEVARCGRPGSQPMQLTENFKHDMLGGSFTCLRWSGSHPSPTQPMCQQDAVRSNQAHAKRAHQNRGYSKGNYSDMDESEDGGSARGLARRYTERAH